MLKLYPEGKVKKLLARMREECEGALADHKREAEALKEENAILSAKVLRYEAERGEVTEALLAAVREGDRMRKELEAEAENERHELALLREKGISLLRSLERRYPDAEERQQLEAYIEALSSALGEQPEETEFDMDEVIAPKQPLDLEKLCKDLGLMEEES